MSRIEVCEENMGKLGVKENDLASNFPSFENLKNRFIYGEVWNQGSMEDQLRSIVVVAVSPCAHIGTFLGSPEILVKTLGNYQRK